MADFIAPTGPPPPKVPEGWKAIWNDQYKEWFYVNIYTKKSQWDKPDSPVYSSGDSADAPPGGPPPAYQDTGAKLGPEKGGFGPGESSLTEDEKLARQLQEEENRRAGIPSGAGTGSRGEADGYYNDPYGQQQQTGGLGVPPTNDGRLSPSGSPGTEKRRSLLGKLFGKDKHGAQQQQYPPPQGYPQQGYYPPQGAPGYGGYGQPGYGQPGYGASPYMQQPGRRPGRAGMGTAGAAALGVGGGLLGGMLLGEAIDGHDGGDGGGYGGDDGGGDYGGDGGGDFGGGDMGGGDF